jgi:hypothetical protein
MKNKNLRSKVYTKGETIILEALKDKKPRAFSELLEKTGLSKPSLSVNLKLLQKNRSIIRDVDSREYSISSEGKNQLEKNNTAETIKNGLLKTWDSPPIDSIVALDIPKIPKSQQKTIMDGTPKIADIIFRQFLLDMKGQLPDSGRLTWTLSIDAKRAKDWLDSAEGKNYKIDALREEE